MTSLRRLLLGSTLLAVPALLVAEGPAKVTAQEKAAQEKAQEKKKAAEQKKKAEGKPPVRVYTNADLEKPEAAKEGGASTTAPVSGEGTSDPESVRRQPFDESAGRRSPFGNQSGELGESDEDPSPDAWRARAEQARNGVAEAQSRVGSVEARIADLRQYLNPMSPSFSIDTNRQLAIQEELRGADVELAEAKEEVKQAQRDWVEFEEEARRAGVSRSVVGDPPP